MILPASYLNGFAPRDGQPLYPSLWTGCVGSWAPCLGPSGLTLRDWSQSRQHGTLTLKAASDWAVVDGRYALAFSGSSTSETTSTQGRVVLTTDLGASSVGISCWLKPSTLTKRGICTSGPNQGIPKFAITLETTGAIIVYRGGNLTSTLTLTAGKSNHFFVWSDGTNTSIWINGKFSNTLGQGINHSAQNQFFIGSNYWGALDGSITQFDFYNVRPSDAVIQMLSIRPGIAYEMAPRRRSSAQSVVSYSTFRPSVLRGSR